MTLHKLNEDALQAQLAKTPGWERVGDAIHSEFIFGDFQEAFAFLTRVAMLAEKADHHPEIFNVYNTVRLTLTTHDAKGLTLKDFLLARKIDTIG